VGKNSLHNVDFVLSSNLVNGFGNLGVVSSILDDALGGFEGVVGSENDVGLLSSNLGVTNDGSVGSSGSVAIDVRTTDDLSNITFLELGGLVSEGGKVTNHVIDGDAARECNASLQVLGLLAVEGLLDFRLNQSVDSLADSVNIGSNDQEGKTMLQSSYNTQS
jgi:hypothetical protein